MKIADIDRFFIALDQRIDTSIEVLITGGAAAILFGGTRATHDIDFEVKIKISPAKSAAAWPKLQQALDEAARFTGIAPQYSDDIDRWSSILMPHKKSQPYKNIGKVQLRVLAPGLWAIGKLSRYLGSDVTDLVDIFSLVKASPSSLAQLWGSALGMSPPSSAQSEFKRHVDHFFDQYAQQIWGKKFSPVDLKRKFLQSAQRIKKT